MSQVELLIAGLLIAITALSALARFFSVPYPIVLVVGGAAVGFVPGLPKVKLAPEVVLVVFLPLLLYGSSIYANFGDLRADLRAITLSAVGLVLVTMCAVAWVAHIMVPGLSWEAAFVLGAIVSPTDPLAASTVMRRLNAPRRMVSAVEGEGLFNDATALIAYRVAVSAVVAGSFSLAEAGLKFVLTAVGGVAIGLAVGTAIAAIRRRTNDAQANVTISLLTGYAAFIPADAIGASGVLATVTAGIYMGIRGPQILPTRTRLQGYFVWDVLDFIVNAILFVLIGLQLRTIVDGLSGYTPKTLIGYGAVVSAVVVGTRLLWLFTIPYLVRTVDRRQSQRARRVGARWRLAMAWSGMRGAVSLAIALALPLGTDAGDSFPKRDLIVFLTFCVIFFTLVVQGLTLPGLLRRLRICDRGEAADEELRARISAAEAAIAEVDLARDEQATHGEAIERTRTFHEHRKRRLEVRAGRIEDDQNYEVRSIAYGRLQRRVIAAQREALLAMRDGGELSNETMNRILRELDLEETRLDA